MLQHLHAGDDVEAARCLGSERLGGDQPVVDRGPGLELVQAGDAQRLVGEVDAGDRGPAPGHRFGEDAAAAADVDDPLAGEAADRRLDPPEPQRIDLVQRAEHRAPGIPPVMRERRELGEFAAIEVAGAGARGGDHWSLSCQSRARAQSAAVSMVVSTRSATTRWPPTQTSVTASRPTTWTRCETGS